jgi:exosortase/archaeosortase
MRVSARRFAAVIGGALFGFAVGASMTTFVTVSSEGALGFGGLAAGVGLGLMVAALVRG